MKKRTKKSKEGEVPETSLVLREFCPDHVDRNGFSWPSKVGVDVTAPGWNDDPKCGDGLHGWLHGRGDYLSGPCWWNAKAKWMVLEVQTSTIIELEGKCKFPRAKVRFVGGRAAAADFIVANEPRAKGAAVIGLSLKVGDNGLAEVGDMGTATAGEGGTATAGYKGTATAGHYGRATAGEGGTATAGKGGTAMAGNWGTATVGKGGIASAGYLGTAIADNCGTATAGAGGTATAGDYGAATTGGGGVATAGEGGRATAGEGGTAIAGRNGTATAGYQGTATAGVGGELRIQWWDKKEQRYRTKIGKVGKGGIRANVAYRLNDLGEFEEVPKA